MAFVAVDKDGSEWIFDVKPYKDSVVWATSQYDIDNGANWFELPKGSIRKLIGRELTWEDEPVELKGEKQMKAKVYCNKQDCTLRKTFIGDTGEYSRNLCCNTDCELAKDETPQPEAIIS